jgi:hypothetical protein
MLKYCLENKTKKMNNNKKTIIFFFLIFVLLFQLTYVNAKTQTLYKDWILDGEIKTIENEDFFVNKHFGCEYVFDKSETKNVIEFISADCEYVAYVKFKNTIYNTFYKNATNTNKDLYCKIIDKHYEICLTDIEYSHHNKTKGGAVFKFYIEITKETGEVKIEKKATKNTLYEREPTEMEIKLIGGEDLAASKINYEETFEDFYLSNAHGCKIINRNKIIITKASLNIKEEYVCRFELFSKINKTYNSQGKLTYNDGAQDITYIPGSKVGEKLQLVIVKNEFNILWNFSKTNENNHTFEIGDEILMQLNLSNSHETEEINPNNVYLNLKGAGKIEDLSDDWKWTEKGYVLNKEILPANNTGYLFKIKFMKSGSYDFEYSGHYIIGERIKKINISQNFEIQTPKTSFFNLTYIKLIEGETQDVYFTFVNPTRHSLKNIELELKSELLNINNTFFIENINPRGFQDLNFENVLIPKLNIENIPINVNVTYLTEYNEKINFEVNFSVYLNKKNIDLENMSERNEKNQTINDIVEELNLKQKNIENAQKEFSKDEYLIIGVVAMLIMVIIIVLIIVYKKNFSE